MTFVLIIGLGIQGQKRSAVLKSQKIKFITLDPFNKKANYNNLKKIPIIIIKKVTDVLLCTPYNQRLSYLKYFQKLKVKILIEKPLITNSEEKKFYLKHKSQISDKIYCAYNHKFEDCIIKLKKLLESGKIGKLYFCKMVYGNGTAKDVRKSNWKNKNKGVVMDLMPHLLDLSNFIFKKVPRFNGRVLRRKFENETTDFFEINSNIKSFDISFCVSYLYWKNFFKIFIVGSKGYLQLTGLPKWGITKLNYGKRKLPSGIPKIKQYDFKQKDFTWFREINSFLKKKTTKLDLKKEIEIYKFFKKC